MSQSDRLTFEFLSLIKETKIIAGEKKFIGFLYSNCQRPRQTAVARP